MCPGLLASSARTTLPVVGVITLPIKRNHVRGKLMDLARAKELSRETWDRRAEEWERDYERIWTATKHVSEWMVERLELESGDTVFEIAAGPGETAFMAGERIGPQGRLIVTDFSQSMVDVARRRAETRGLAGVDFRVLDAEKMDLEDDAVDKILCRWGFMLMVDPDAAFSECARVLRSNGRLVFATWSTPDENPWITVFGMVLVPMGLMERVDPFGPGGMFSLSDPDLIRSKLEQADFADVDIEKIPVTFRDESFDVYFDRQTKTAGPIADILQNLEADELAEVRRAVKDLLEPYIESDQSIAIPGVAVVTAATCKK